MYIGKTKILLIEGETVSPSLPLKPLLEKDRMRLRSHISIIPSFLTSFLMLARRSLYLVSRCVIRFSVL